MALIDLSRLRCALEQARQMRFYDLEPRCAPYFVCSLCGRSFAGSEASNDP